MEALEKIKQAEAERNKLIENAKSAVPVRCREAELEVERKLAQAESRIKEEVDEMLKNGRGKVDEEIRTLTSEYEKDRDKLRKQVLKNKQEAVEFIKKNIL